MQHRKWTMILMAVTLVTAWSFQAQALSITLDSSRRAKFVEAGGDTVVFRGKRGGARGVFTVTLDTPGTVDITVKRRGKRAKRFTTALAAGTYEYSNRGRKKVVMSFSESGTTTPSVPEPGTLALMGFGLAGLAYRGRRRS